MTQPVTKKPARRNARGRKSKFNKATVEKICGGLSIGLPQHFAASLGGVTATTFHAWRNRYASFRKAVEEAIAKGMAYRLGVIQNALASNDENVRLRAATWWLEHCMPEHFAKNRIEVTGADGSPLAAGISLYLPKKETPPDQVIELKPQEPNALTERNNGVTP